MFNKEPRNNNAQHECPFARRMTPRVQIKLAKGCRADRSSDTAGYLKAVISRKQGCRVASGYAFNRRAATAHPTRCPEVVVLEYFSWRPGRFPSSGSLALWIYPCRKQVTDHLHLSNVLLENS